MTSPVFVYAVLRQLHFILSTWSQYFFRLIGSQVSPTTLAPSPSETVSTLCYIFELYSAHDRLHWKTHANITRRLTLIIHQLCLLVTTGFGEYHDGSVDVYVDNGSGYGLVSLSGKEHVQGEFVVDRCYDRIDGIQIRSNSNNGWLGMVELSTDGKRSYNPFICSNCTGTMNVMPIVVDTDWDGWGGPIAMCLGGSICSLEVSAIIELFLFLLIM